MLMYIPAKGMQVFHHFSLFRFGHLIFPFRYLRELRPKQVILENKYELT